MTYPGSRRAPKQTGFTWKYPALTPVRGRLRNTVTFHRTSPLTSENSGLSRHGLFGARDDDDYAWTPGGHWRYYARRQTGHSIGSASIMGQVRSLLHGYAIDNPSPPEVLRRTNAAMCRMLPDALATVWYAVLDMSTGDLDFASAGHLPPLINSGGGHAEYLDVAPGTILGATPDATYTVARLRLPSGARLLLYTDGLVEDRHRDITEGLTALIAALQRSSGQTAEEICQSAETSMLGTTPRADDVCILAVALTPSPASRPNS